MSKYHDKKERCGAIHPVRKIVCWAPYHDESEPHWAWFKGRKITWRGDDRDNAAQEQAGDD